MLNVPKTVRLLFTIRVVVEWQVLLDKEHYEISMQMGEDTCFLKLELLIHNSYCSWHELSPPFFDGTNRKALHPVIY
jgi:hypothetical protein